MHVELLAIQEALAFANKYCCQQFSIESDYLPAIKPCSAFTEMWPWDVDVIGQEILRFISPHDNIIGIVSNESKKRHVNESHIVYVDKFSSVYNGISCRSLQEYQAPWAL